MAVICREFAWFVHELLWLHMRPHMQNDRAFDRQVVISLEKQILRCAQDDKQHFSN
jgi:hypothetical protein